MSEPEKFCGHPEPNWEGQAMKCVHPIPCPRHAPTATTEPTAPSEPEIDPKALEIVKRIIAWDYDTGGDPYEGSCRAIMAYAAEREAKLREERDTAVESVNHWRVKAECYGGIVHACTPALEAAGHPVDASGTDGSIGGIRRAVEALVAERDAARADVIAAAKELLIPIPEPGSLVSVLLIANRRLREELDAAIKAREDTEAYLEARVMMTPEEIKALEERAAKAEVALRAVKKDREYQKLHGGPHFTSAPTEMEWKAESAREAWALVDEVLAALPEPKEPKDKWFRGGVDKELLRKLTEPKEPTP